MLRLVDQLLRVILMDALVRLQPSPPPPPPPVTQSQVRFDPPDDLSRAYVGSTLNREAFNVYLVEQRENRKLRSNERARDVQNGMVIEEPAPARLDCHYVISGWVPSPASISQQLEPTLDEHRLLYEAAAVLFQNAPLNPSRIYPDGSAPLNAWPEPFRKVDLPTTVAPAEGYPKLAEFWGTMGTGHRWKPALYVVVTVPVRVARQVVGPMVTTRITEYRLEGAPESAEVWIQIGGTVYDVARRPVPSAWVRLETTAGVPLQTVATDGLGRFTLGGLRSDRYGLRAGAVGLGETQPRTVEVPSPSGEYDLAFP
jgi:Pvc16 N-terminal domain/Carboxypeptidase regulatory-like domain